MRKKFVAVIGHGKSGKSTIIQSLTGCESRSFINVIEDRTTGLSIYVHAPSPQEHPQTDIKIFRDILQDILDDAKIQGIVIAIQPTCPTQRLSMEEMFEAAKNAKFESYAFILEPPYGGRLTDFESVQKRVLANDKNAQVYKLDGRRFGILNAEAIRALSRLPY